MFENLTARKMFAQLLGRPDIDKAYAMVPPTDSWYDTITKVHNSLAEIRKLPHEMLEITAHDHARLKGVYYPGDGRKDVTVICIHGYTSHAEREWAFPGLFYLSLGYSVLIPYQRAHGPSEGRYITFGALERRDMLGWVNKVNELTPNHAIIIHGLSMGGGIALQLTDKSMKNVRGIISDAPSASLRDLLQAVAGEYAKKHADKVAACAIRRFEKEFRTDMRELECADVVTGSKYPILLSAGSMENMETYFAQLQKANPCRTEIIILPGCAHGNGMYKQTGLYQRTIREFVEGLLAC